ncbi:hypothetical protein KMZ29_06245 [Bradyrhizobium sediminis]|uniref:Uncharacterized protein n=1 Tax=Bradyrhizobium sediminis TaxID=2840469 RepID=A0A975RP61_9BRAD|nr:hypothetical protein [Bradyrhizobium sediminis]QWG14281.1 hypothetical protein KMZ29_06245 [Bradyrhizobium sediminis]
MDGVSFALLIGVVLVAAFLICGLLIDNQNLRNRRSWEERDRKLKIKRLREENEIIALEQHKKFLEEIRPLKTEAKGASLLKIRDEQTVDALLARDALSKTIEMLRGAPRLIDGNPLASSVSALVEEIENRRADGAETTELEEIVRQLRTIPAGRS